MVFKQSSCLAQHSRRCYCYSPVLSILQPPNRGCLRPCCTCVMILGRTNCEEIGGRWREPRGAGTRKLVSGRPWRYRTAIAISRPQKGPHYCQSREGDILRPGPTRPRALLPIRRQRPPGAQTVLAAAAGGKRRRVGGCDAPTQTETRLPALALPNEQLHMQTVAPHVRLRQLVVIECHLE